MMKRCVLAALGFVSALATTASAQVKWDLPTQWPADNFYTKMIVQYADRVKGATQGQVQITVHSGGALGFKGPDMLAAVRDGIVPIGDVTAALAAGEEPFLGIDRIPFVYPNYEAFSTFMAFARPVYDRIYAKHKQTMLFLVPWPPTKAHTKTPLRSLDDLKGLKIRTHERLGTTFFQGIGASPVQLPWAEVVPSLASGAIAGVNTSASSATDGKFWEFLKHTMLFELQWATSGINVNDAALAKLKPEHRAAVLSVAREMEPQFWLASKQEDERTLKLLVEHGMKIDPLPADVRAKAMEVAGAQMAEFAKNSPDAAAVFTAWRAYVK
jgi:TRAP-type C4-dicarboxylate transport system substrate-binding protein